MKYKLKYIPKEGGGKYLSSQGYYDLSLDWKVIGLVPETEELIVLVKIQEVKE